MLDSRDDQEGGDSSRGHSRDNLINSSDDFEEEDERVERLLSEKLVEGYLLLDNACPVCATPLIKEQQQAKQQVEVEEHSKSPKQFMNTSSRSFDKPLSPILGVPFCVCCQSHVITEADQVRMLEQSSTGALKGKGSVLIAMATPDAIEEVSGVAITL